MEDYFMKMVISLWILLTLSSCSEPEGPTDPTVIQEGDGGGSVTSGGGPKSTSIGGGKAPSAVAKITSPKKAPDQKNSIQVSSRRPFVVLPGQSVFLGGANFKPIMTVAVGGEKVKVNVAGDSAASFLVPEDALGLTNVEIKQENEVFEANILIVPSLEIPVITEEPDQVCVGKKYHDQDGFLRTGTKECATSKVVVADSKENVTVPKPSCSKDGQVDCVSTSAFPAADASSTPSKVLKGETVAGKAGSVILPTPGKVLKGEPFGPLGSLTGSLTLPSEDNVRVANGTFGVPDAVSSPRIVDCKNNLQKNCFLDNSGLFSAGDLSNLKAENIRRGETIAGVTGIFPSSQAQLPRFSGPSGTATAGSDEDDLINFITQLTRDGTFEFWDSTGTRRTGSGDSNIKPESIGRGVALDNFGIEGTAFVVSQCQAAEKEACLLDKACGWTGSSCEISAANVRIGTTIAEKAGTLKVSCRNGARAASYNYDGPLTGIPTTAIKTGLSIDIWDTVDDNAAFAGDAVPDWGAGKLCGASVWSDATTLDGGQTASSCSGGTTGGTCVMKNASLSILLTGVLSVNVDKTNTTTPGKFTWPSALNACNSSAYGGFAAGSWRLPTQKELMAIYASGIVSVLSPNFVTKSTLGTYFWSSSSLSTDGSKAWVVRLLDGATTTSVKTTSTYRVLCVRD
jgi:hypothetical protein